MIKLITTAPSWTWANNTENVGKITEANTILEDAIAKSVFCQDLLAMKVIDVKGKYDSDSMVVQMGIITGQIEPLVKNVSTQVNRVIAMQVVSTNSK